MILMNFFKIPFRKIDKFQVKNQKISLFDLDYFFLIKLLKKIPNHRLSFNFSLFSFIHAAYFLNFSSFLLLSSSFFVLTLHPTSRCVIFHNFLLLFRIFLYVRIIFFIISVCVCVSECKYIFYAPHVPNT